MSFSTPKVKKKYNKQSSISLLKRTFPSASNYCIRGGLTLEAAMVTPLIIILCIILLSPIIVLNSQLALQKRLFDCSLKMCEGSYVANNAQNKNVFLPLSDSELNTIAATGVSLVYAENDIFKDNLRDSLHFFHNTSLLGSRIDDESGKITLKALYTIEIPFIEKVTRRNIFAQQVSIRPYLGKSIKAVKDDTNYVYVSSKAGKCYHCNQHCPYLYHITKKIRKHDSTFYDLEYNGIIYEPCSFCARKHNRTEDDTICYITEEGEVYHTDLNCRILQHDIMRIDISKGTQGYRPCSKCYPDK